MCGICGIIGNDRPGAVERMVSSMHHRGPDDSGVYKEPGIAIGMARLSIIDVTLKAHQPMCNDNRKIWIVYNGETYNFRNERDLLEKKGYVFKSASDTEVVLKMYEEYGDDFLKRMRGIFALAIYDKRKDKKNRVLLARDQLGVKPLLYAHSGSTMIFASEMKCILSSGLIEKRIDPESLRLLLTFGSVLQPKTIITGVHMLMPGHRMIIEDGNITCERYWNLDINRFPQLARMSYPEQVEYVKQSLHEAVRMQMISDVPIGAFLSGGVDSSLLCAFMAQECGTAVKTFSVGFESEGTHIDETADALRTARFLNTDHSRVVVTADDIRKKIFHIAGALDQPTVDGVNSYFVSMAAKQSVTVAISGTGGDELFTGYPWFISMARKYSSYDNSILKKYLKGMISRAFKTNITNALPERMIYYIKSKSGIISDFISDYALQYLIFGAQGAESILSAEYLLHCHAGREPGLDIAGGDELPFASTIPRVSALCLRGYTQNQLLRDIDAVSMAHSLEVRVPFLDHIIADISLSLPDSAKLSNFSNDKNPYDVTYREAGVKKILVDICHGLLPGDIDLQKKRGFGMPFTHWLNTSLRDILEDTLSAESLSKRGCFNILEATRITNDFFLGKINWPLPWLLMIFELWCRAVLDGDAG